MAVRDILNYQGIKIGELEMPDNTSEIVWTQKLAIYAADPTKPLNQIVSEKISYYQSLAPKLLNDIKTSNTLSGITLAQSAQMFTDFQTVLLAIKEGAFPTAIYMLGQMSPSGFVTQPMINDWINRITGLL